MSFSPTPRVEWIKMGEKLPRRIKYKNFGKLLSIPDVEEGDEGKYMCKAENPAGMAVHYFDVIVEGIARLIYRYRCDRAVAGDESCLHFSLSLTHLRAAKMADGASSGPADCGRIRHSHQVLGHWKTTAGDNVEEERRDF